MAIQGPIPIGFDQVFPHGCYIVGEVEQVKVSLWLNAGVAAPDVAERAGHGVDVLLKVYAKCIDGGMEIANRRIEDALAA
ncbi:hypothetical protein [Streptosporangium minutum]|uniref:Uncharacterized protein n=1 Tax=Streptosporangium minutum TaxID=569862 RepID=A0A243RM79_9ACTN|nr:hypothetical protein CA984_16380 [Streptosporangium minutum]